MGYCFYVLLICEFFPRFKYSWPVNFDDSLHLEILKEALLRAIHDIDATFSKASSIWYILACFRIIVRYSLPFDLMLTFVHLSNEGSIQKESWFWFNGHRHTNSRWSNFSCQHWRFKSLFVLWKIPASCRGKRLEWSWPNLLCVQNVRWCFAVIIYGVICFLPAKLHMLPMGLEPTTSPST